MRVAALTMVYNEPVWARVWVRHYSAQVGAEHCVVLDHGTDDGSTDRLGETGVAVERMRRTALDEVARAALISDCVRELLRRYDAVVHTDADELLIAAPGLGDLRRYAAGAFGVAGAGPVATAVGLDLQHLPDEEGALDADAPIGAQRQWVRFSGSMCKPALVREAVRWSPGFHACDAPRAVAPLYLVHLRYADLGAGLRRLARTRGQTFAGADVNLHQRVPDAAFEAMVRAVAGLPRVEGELAALAAPMVARMMEGWARGEEQLGLSGDALWRLPEAMRSVL